MTSPLPTEEFIDENDITTIVIYNPLDYASKEMFKLVYEPGKTLDKYLDGLPDHIDWYVVLNTEEVEKEDFATTIVEPSSYLSLVPMLHGGGGAGGAGGSKNIMRVVALLAITVAAAATGGAAAPFLVGGLGAIGAGIAGAAITASITIGGSILVNTLMPAPTQIGKKQKNESPTYGIDGPKNTSTEEIAVPVVYGDFRVAGNIVSEYAYNIGKDQVLNILIAVSEGEVEDLTDIQFNDQPITNFKNVDSTVRKGTDNQSLIPWFENDTVPINKNAKLGTDWFTHTTLDTIDKFRLDLTFPEGLYGQKTNNQVKERDDRSVTFEVQYQKTSDQPDDWASLLRAFDWEDVDDYTLITDTYAFSMDVVDSTVDGQASKNYSFDLKYRRAGSSDWISEVRKGTIYSIYATSVQGNQWIGTEIREIFQVDGLPHGNYEVQVNGGNVESPTAYRADVSLTVQDKTTNAKRVSFESSVLDDDFYNIRIRRTSGEAQDDGYKDTVYLTDVNEINIEQVRYNFTALLGLSIKLDDQINSQPNVTILCKGRKVDIYDPYGVKATTAKSSNPAWVSLDMLTNTRYGAGISLAYIDLPAFSEWADRCNTRLLEFNGIFDTTSNVWDALQIVLRAGRAQLVRTGLKYSVIFEDVALPVFMFTSANIVKGSLQLDWLSFDDRANEVEVTYYNRDDNYKQDTLRVIDYEAYARGEKQKVSSVNLIGVTNRDIAWKEGWLHLRMNQYLKQTASWISPFSCINCTIGDVVLLQHDMPFWGFGGRVLPDSTKALVKLDQVIQVDTSKTYRFVLHFSAKMIAAFKVLSISGNTIKTTKIDSSVYEPTKVRWNGKEITVLRTITDQTYSAFVLEDATGIALRDTVEIWQTDVFETRDMTFPESTLGNISEIPFSPALNQDPDEFANFMFGEVGKVKKPFRITSINYANNDETRQIKAVEYYDAIYADPEHAPPPPNFSGLTDSVAQVIITDVRDRTQSIDSVPRNFINVVWDASKVIDYAGADIWVSFDNESYRLTAQATNGATSAEFEGFPGQTVGIKVVAYDVGGQRANFDKAPVVTYSVARDRTAPAPPSNGAGLGILFGIEVDWINAPDADLKYVEIYENTINTAPNPDTQPDRLANKVLAEPNKAGGYQRLGLDPGTQRYYWIRSIDTSGNASDLVPGPNSGLTGVALDRFVTDTTPPAIPTGLSATGAIRAITLSWTNPTDADLAGVAIYENTINNSAGATVVATQSATPGANGQFTRTGLTVGSQRFYWLKAFDFSDNYSGFSTGAGATATGVGSGDIEVAAVTQITTNITPAHDGSSGNQFYSTWLDLITVTTSADGVGQVMLTFTSLSSDADRQYVGHIKAVGSGGMTAQLQIIRDDGTVVWGDSVRSGSSTLNIQTSPSITLIDDPGVSTTTTYQMYFHSDIDSGFGRQHDHNLNSCTCVAVEIKR